jgi:hypothetical protein
MMLSIGGGLSFFVLWIFLRDEDRDRKLRKNGYWMAFFNGMSLLGAFGVGFTLLTAYDANTDIATATRVIKQDTTVSSADVLAEMKLYKPNNPAHVFLTQYYLLPKKDGNSIIVWDIVKKRAAYVSNLYHTGELAKNAAIPNFGFLPANKNTVDAVLSATDNKLQHKEQFLKLRRHGYTVRYADQAVNDIRDVVQGKARYLDGIRSKTKALTSIQSENVIGPNFSLLPKVAEQLDTTVNVQQATNSYLGRNYSLREIIRKYLAKKP